MDPDTEKVPRRNRSVRLTKAAETAIQDRATADGIQWSEEARRMLAYAHARMPAGWHPGKER